MSVPADVQDNEVVVLSHAIDQARARWNLSGTDTEIAVKVAAFVQRGVDRKQLFERKPRPFRPYGHDGYMLPWQRLVAFDDFACVVAFDQVGKTVVVTALSRVAKVAGLQPRGRPVRR
jgi:hypothetical protein